VQYEKLLIMIYVPPTGIY